MAKVVAKFEKVSYEQFKKDWEDTFNASDEEIIRKIYDGIKLPKRATVGSAGYDFFTPIGLKIKPGKTVKVPTGIRCKIDNDWVLKCYPRSGLGFKFRLQLNNTVGIITNDTNEEKVIGLKSGEGFMQGIFVEYGITEDDDATGIRNGGFGSTTE